MSEPIRQRFATPPYHISFHLGQANEATLRRLLCRYDLRVDNGTFTRRNNGADNGAEVDVKLYRCPTHFIPLDVPSSKFVVHVASEPGGLSDPVLLAPLPGATVYQVWKGPQEGWDSADLIIKSFNKDNDQVGMAVEKSTLAATIEIPMDAEWKHDVGGYARTHTESSQKPDRNDGILQSLMTQVGSNQERNFSLDAHADTDSDSLGPSTATSRAPQFALRHGLAAAPEHIVKQLQQASNSTLRTLIRKNLAGSILRQRGYYVPNDAVPAALGNWAKIVLVASGHRLTDSVIIGRSNDSTVLRVWRAATGYESSRQVEKQFVSCKKRIQSESSDDDSDASFEDYNNVDSEVGNHNIISTKRLRTPVDYARIPEIESDEQVLKRHRLSKGTRNLGLSAIPATAKHTIRDQSFYPSAPYSEPTRQLMTPTPTVNRRSTSHPVQRETDDAPIIVNRGPQVLSGSDKRARTTLCFLRASSDVSLKFPLSVADSIEKFFKLAEVAHTIRPGQETAALSASVPGVETAVDLLLFAGYGFAELLEKIESSVYWEDAGEEGQCMVEVREFGEGT